MPLADNQTRQQIVARVLAARERRTEFLTQMKARQQQGWQAACIAAKVLKEFGAHRVVLFGSMLAPERMTWHSDIDLAVWVDECVPVGADWLDRGFDAGERRCYGRFWCSDEHLNPAYC